MHTWTHSWGKSNQNNYIKLKTSEINLFCFVLFSDPQGHMIHAEEAYKVIQHLEDSFPLCLWMLSYCCNKYKIKLQDFHFLNYLSPTLSLSETWKTHQVLNKCIKFWGNFGSVNFTFLCAVGGESDFFHDFMIIQALCWAKDKFRLIFELPNWVAV